jgi:hypothetical protein
MVDCFLSQKVLVCDLKVAASQKVAVGKELTNFKTNIQNILDFSSPTSFDINSFVSGEVNQTRKSSSIFAPTFGRTTFLLDLSFTVSSSIFFLFNFPVEGEGGLFVQETAFEGSSHAKGDVEEIIAFFFLT